MAEAKGTEVMTHSRSLQAATREHPGWLELDGAVLRDLVVAVAILLIATCLLGTRAFAEGGGKEAKKEERAYDERLKQEREAAERRNQQTNAAGNPDAEKALRKADKERREKEAQKQDLAEYKEKTFQNLGQIKEMMASADGAFKEKQYAKAAAFYQSVAGATVPGSETMAQSARDKLVAMEDLAKARLKAAEDADLEGNYTKEVEELGIIATEFKDTKVKEIAMRRLISLKSKPEVAAEVEYMQAESMLGEGKMLAGIEVLKSLANNPRYENSVAQFKAKRKLDELNESEDARAKVKAEYDAKVEKEAPAMLAAAKNFVSNHKPKLAIEKLQQLIEKFPDTTYAEQAKKQIEELK
jgi:hypothetical protein